MRLAYVGARVTADRESLLTFARLSRIEVHEERAPETVRLRLRPLGGLAVEVRPSTSDVDTVWGAFARRYHLPPIEDPLLILDLGANIGLTMADLAARYPAARVVGVELDDVNAALARRNTAAFGERCQVIRAAVWPEDGEVFYLPWPGGTSGYRAHRSAPEGAEAVPAVSLRTLVEDHGDIDYLKVDIEGAERELLCERTGWASHVRSLKVEVHQPYTAAACAEDLRRLGFRAWVDRRHWACAAGVRDA
jgi:FkbM family methyltransferase